MEEKGMFFVIVMALVVIAVFVYLGVRTYKEVKEPGDTTPVSETGSTPALGVGVLPRTSDSTVPSPGSSHGSRSAAPRDAAPPSAGNAYYRQGNYAEALDSFKRVLAADPGNDTARESAAGCQAMLDLKIAMLGKRWDEALRACDEAGKHSISATDASRRKAEVLERQAYDRNYEQAKQAAARNEFDTAQQCFREACRIAARLGINTDADQLLTDLRGKRATATAAANGMAAVIQVVSDRNDPYALYAAVTQYISSSDGYKPDLAVFQARLDTATKTIAGNRDKYPSPRVSEAVTWDVVKMQSGGVEKGQIVLEDEKVLKLRQEKNGKTVVRTLLVRDVAEKTKETVTADDANNKRAEALLAETVSEVESKHYFQALSTLGILMHEFRDAALMKDVPRQEQVIAAAGVGTALKGGSTLQKLIEVCLDQCQKVCPKCEGAGSFPCATCKGEGKVPIVCPMCNATGKVMCMMCQGQGKVMSPTTTSLLRCQACGGRGTFTCTECKGAKTARQTCPGCNGQKTVPCEGCLGSGMRPGMNRQ